VTTKTQSRFPVEKYLAPRYWSTWFGMGLLRLATVLPWRAQVMLGKQLGDLLRLLVGSRRKVAEINIALCFPELDRTARNKLLARHFQSLGITLFESAMSWWGSARRIDSLFRFDGGEHWQAQLDEGRGAILLYGHYTTLDIAGRMLAAHVDEVVPSYKPAHNALFNEMMVRARERTYRGLLPTSDLRALVREINKGRLVSYSPDQDFGTRNAVFSPFMGVPATSLTTTARLARITGAAVIPLLIERSADGCRYSVQLGAPIEGFPSGDEVRDAALINASIEAQIRRVPDQYLWVHKRFKTRPEGEPDPYR